MSEAKQDTGEIGSLDIPPESLPSEIQSMETPVAVEKHTSTSSDEHEPVITAPTAQETQRFDETSPDQTVHNAVTTTRIRKSESLFQIEKPKMPKFASDVREYETFGADFKHLVECRYNKRDSITILRSSLQGIPLEMIKGIGQDYKAAWGYLDSVYGDARFVADVITQDISKFKPIKDGKDARFCDLVHLVKRSFNTLKKVGRENDMNNNHMLAITERKPREHWISLLITRHFHENGHSGVATTVAKIKKRC